MDGYSEEMGHHMENQEDYNENGNNNMGGQEDHQNYDDDVSRA